MLNYQRVTVTNSDSIDLANQGEKTPAMDKFGE
jgi:hypothetical protein